MTSMLTCHPDTLSKDVQDKRIRNEQHTQAVQEGACPAHAEVMEHSCCEQREASSERGSHKVISSQGGGSLFWICMCQVGKDTVENKTATDSKEYRGYGRDDPVDRSKVTCPAKPEDGDRE